MTDKKVKELTAKVRQNFRCFGGGLYNPNNPISAALADKPAQFAAGVDVEEVVRFILKHSK